MTTGLVGQHQLAPFASPQPGQPLDATVVLGNDNSTVTTYDAHDSDSTIHFQSSALADRPPASTLGQKWLTTDAGARYIYYDNGSAWVEVDYFRDTGGTIVGDVTVTGNVSISGTLGVTGVATFTAAPILSSLTASKPVFTNSSKGLVSTGTLGTDQGGTNLTTYTTGDILYASATNVLSKLAIGTTGQHLIVSGGVPAWSTDSALGTVTSVSFTGGLISVATATTTPALTVAGTSGGVVYFSSASTWASSAALTASAIVLGGGAGAAPATTTTGTGVVTALGVNVGTAGAFVVNGGALGTPSSGAVAASLITAGTFGAGAYTFPGALAITGALTGVTTLTASSTATIGAATSPLLLDRLADYTNYGAMSFNASLTSTTMNGLYGRLNATDGGLYITAPSGSSTKVQVAGSTVATFAGALTTLATPLAITGAFTGATTGAFSGKITSTVGNNAIYFESASATTGYHYAQIKNTSAWMIFGIEGSVAGSLATNSTAYSTVLVTANATDLIFGTNQTTNLKIASGGAATFSSTLAVTGDVTGGSHASFGVSATIESTIALKGKSSTATSASYAFFCRDSADSGLFNVRGDGLVTVPGTLAVTGLASFNGAAVASTGTAAAQSLSIDNTGDDKPMIAFRRGGTVRNYLRLNTDNDFRLLNSDLATGSGLTMGALYATTGTFSSTLGVTGAATFSSTAGVTARGLNLTDGDTIQWTSSSNRVFFNGGAFRVDVNGSQYLGISTAGAVTAAGVYSTTVGATNRDLYIDNTGLIGYVSSIRAAKTNITPLTDTSWLDALTPVAFNYRKKDEDGAWTDEANTPLEYGLIAEEVEGVNPELVFYDETEDGLALRGVSYNKLMIPLLQRVQALTARVAALEGV